MKSPMLLALVAMFMVWVGAVWTCTGAACAPQNDSASKAAATDDSSTLSGTTDDGARSNDGTQSDDSSAQSNTGSGGTIEPQDQTSATSASGTVRVNNLANLEALLNIIANCTEILGLALGGLMLVGGTAGAIIGGKKRWIGFVIIVVGIVFAVGGLATPGIINWFVQSARDANLFS